MWISHKNANLVKEVIFRINAKLVKEELADFLTLCVGFSLQSMAVMSDAKWSSKKLQKLFILMRYGKIQHMSNE